MSLRKEVVSAGQVFGVSRIVYLNDGKVLIEFPTEPGALYMVQISENLGNWTDSLVRLRAAGNRVQWIDHDGDSSEPTSPLGGGRFYRVLRLAE